MTNPDDNALEEESLADVLLSLIAILTKYRRQQEANR